MTRRRTGGVGALAGRRISRRDFLRVGGAGLAGAALLGTAGCGGGGGGGGSGQLTFSMGPDPSGLLQKLVDEFNEQNEGEIQVNYREMPADTGQYFDQLRTEFQAGGGDIDIIGADVIWPAQFAANGWITDVSDRFPESERQKFLSGPIESLTYEGAIYGIPWFTDAGMLYYRQDLLEQSGFSEPPKTWEELKEMAQKVQQDSGTRDGFVFQGSEYEGGTVNGLEYIRTHGGDVLNARGDEVVIDSPESVAGLETEHSMVADGVAPQSVANFKETESHTNFLNGNSVFIRNWPYMYALAADPDQSKIKQNQIGVAPLPAAQGGQSFSGLGGWNMLINAATDNVDGAWKFVQFMTSEQIQKRRALEGSFLPTLTSLYDDQEVTEKVPVIRLGREALENAKPRPVSPYYSDMSLKMAEQFNSTLKDETSPDQAIQTLQQELSDIVQQAG